MQYAWTTSVKDFSRRISCGTALAFRTTHFAATYYRNEKIIVMSGLRMLYCRCYTVCYNDSLCFTSSALVFKLWMSSFSMQHTSNAIKAFQTFIPCILWDFKSCHNRMQYFSLIFHFGGNDTDDMSLQKVYLWSTAVNKSSVTNVSCLEIPKPQGKLNG